MTQEMAPELKRLLERSGSRKAQNKQTLDRLRKDSPKLLQSRFLEAHEQAFQTISCLDCANCCKSVGPLLNSQDIDRCAKALKMKRSEFIGTYLKEDEDGDLVFSSHPCPFLCSDNRCLIYESRPKACREYPHTDQRYIHRYLKQTYENSRHCPAVAKMLEILQNS